jgi:hypothetical protein
MVPDHADASIHQAIASGWRPALAPLEARRLAMRSGAAA